jgi:hypothetical protein
MKGLTGYQLEVLTLAAAGNPVGTGPIDFDQLLDRLSWTPSKQSAQFTIRACISKGVLEKTDRVMRRGRLRVCYQLTEKGRLALDPRGPVPVPGPDKSVTTDVGKVGLEVLPEGLEELGIDPFRELPAL